MTGKPNRGVLQYFRCERDLLLRAEEACEHFSVPADKNIKDLCRNMENYRQCYAGIPHRCTPNALKLKKRIDESLMETTENLVKITTGMVPSECSAWREQSLRQHEWRTAGEDEDDEEYEEDLDFTSFNNSYVNNTAQNSTFSKILYRFAPPPHN